MRENRVCFRTGCSRVELTRMNLMRVSRIHGFTNYYREPLFHHARITKSQIHDKMKGGASITLSQRKKTTQEHLKMSIFYHVFISVKYMIVSGKHEVQRPTKILSMTLHLQSPSSRLSNFCYFFGGWQFDFNVFRHEVTWQTAMSTFKQDESVNYYPVVVGNLSISGYNAAL